MPNRKLQQKLKGLGFEPLPRSEKYAHIAAEFPMRFMNLTHFEEGRVVSFVIAFDDTEGVWFVANTMFSGDRLNDLGFTEMFKEDLTTLFEKKPN